MGEDVFINLERLIKSLESVAEYTLQPGFPTSDPVDRMLAETTSLIEPKPEVEAEAEAEAEVKAETRENNSSKTKQSSDRVLRSSNREAPSQHRELPDTNPLILNTKRERKTHSYKQLNRRGFAKAAITTKTPKHNVKTPKT